MGFLTLVPTSGHETTPLPEENSIDVIAVHDFGEDALQSWTHPETRANWLKDFLPRMAQVRTVLVYEHNLSRETFFGSRSQDLLRQTAETFVQELHAERNLARASGRPIIFVCHGLGGLVVKQALSYSQSRTASKVAHLRDVYVSTFAIFFFGTPHDRASSSNWTKGPKAQPAVQCDQESHLAGSRDFSRLLKSFYVFCFWEELPTRGPHRTSVVVDYSSAVIQLDNTEKASIHANHRDMVKFKSIDCPSLRTVTEAITRYSEIAGPIIQRRRAQHKRDLANMRFDEAYELDATIYDIRATPGPGSASQDSRHQSPVARLHHLPVAAITGFVGRKAQLSSIYRKFFCRAKLPDHARKSFVVYGMGGSGKTQLCSTFASEHREKYNAVLTIHAASPKTIEDSYIRFATIGGLHSTRDAGRYFLENQEGTWLLIIDNADDPSLDLNDLIPDNVDCHVLITTRNPKFRIQGTLGYLELGALSKDEALELLLTRAGFPRPWDSAVIQNGLIVAESLGHLALALIHAGNCVERGLCTLEKYPRIHSETRKMFRTRTGIQASLPSDRQVTEDEMRIFSAFELSFETMCRKQTIKTRDAVELLNILAFYHFESIPELIFTRAMASRRSSGLDNPRSTHSWMSSSRLFIPPIQLPQFLLDEPEHLNECRITYALDELHSVSLITRDPPHMTFSLHPLVHEWAQDRVRGRAERFWMCASLNTLLESVTLELGAQRSVESGESEANDFHESILPHLNKCLEHHGSPMSDIAVHASWLSLLLWVQPGRRQAVRAELLNAGKCALVFAERGHFERAATYLKGVVRTLLRLQGLYSEMSMSVGLRLSKLYWGMAQLSDSIALHNRVAQARSYVHGPNHEKTLEAESSLGHTYWLHGDYVRSLSILTSVCDRMKAALEESHPQLLIAMDNLGVTLDSWRRYDESMHIHKQVLKLREKQLGTGHPDTLPTKAHLGMALLGLEQFQEAELLLRGVWEERQKLLGKEHPWTLWALCYLSKIWIALGSLEEAENLLLWGLEAAVRSLGEDHVGVCMGRGCLALVYSRQDRLAEAEKLTLRILGDLERTLTAEHPDTIYCRWKLAILFQKQKRFDEAVVVCERALDCVEPRISRDHPLAHDLEKLLSSLHAEQDEQA